MPPATFDLSQYAPTPGDQGQTGACAAFATGYSAMGWWANRVGLGGTPFAPMYLYAQEVMGQCDLGSDISGNMDIMMQQGTDTTIDYEPNEQNLDCATLPTAAQTANAASYKIASHDPLDLTVDPQLAIETAISSGLPVVLGINAYDELMNATATNYVVGPPAATSTNYGGHAITAFKYDSVGVWILNSWNTTWGLSGWAELTWSFITGTAQGQANCDEADVILGVLGGSSGGSSGSSSGSSSGGESGSGSSSGGSGGGSGGQNGSSSGSGGVASSSSSGGPAGGSGSGSGGFVDAGSTGSSAGFDANLDGAAASGCSASPGHVGDEGPLAFGALVLLAIRRLAKRPRRAR